MLIRKKAVLAVGSGWQGPVAVRCGLSQVEWHVIYNMKMTTTGGMRRLDLDDRSVWIDDCRVVTLLGAMAASTAGLARTMRIYLLLR